MRNLAGRVLKWLAVVFVCGVLFNIVLWVVFNPYPTPMFYDSSLRHPDRFQRGTVPPPAVDVYGNLLFADYTRNLLVLIVSNNPEDPLRDVKWNIASHQSAFTVGVNDVLVSSENRNQLIVVLYDGTTSRHPIATGLSHLRKDIKYRDNIVDVLRSQGVEIDKAVTGMPGPDQHAPVDR